MRLIDADALIQDMIDKKIPFNADVNEAILNAREIGGYADYVDRVWEIAYERGKNEALQWIPCSERLPDKDGEYLASFDNEPIGIIPFNVATHSFGFWDEGFDDVGIVVSCNWFGIEPIAWMPLPEPYTETKEETND